MKLGNNWKVAVSNPTSLSGKLTSAVIDEQCSQKLLCYCKESKKQCEQELTEKLACQDEHFLKQEAQLKCTKLDEDLTTQHHELTSELKLQKSLVKEATSALLNERANSEDLRKQLQTSVETSHMQNIAIDSLLSALQQVDSEKGLQRVRNERRAQDVRQFIRGNKSSPRFELEQMRAEVITLRHQLKEEKKFATDDYCISHAVELLLCEVCCEVTMKNERDYFEAIRAQDLAKLEVAENTLSITEDVLRNQRQVNFQEHKKITQLSRETECSQQRTMKLGVALQKHDDLNNELKAKLLETRGHIVQQEQKLHQCISGMQHNFEDLQVEIQQTSQAMNNLSLDNHHLKTNLQESETRAKYLKDHLDQIELQLSSMQVRAKHDAAKLKKWEIAANLSEVDARNWKEQYHLMKSRAHEWELKSNEYDCQANANETNNIKYEATMAGSRARVIQNTKVVVKEHDELRDRVLLLEEELCVSGAHVNKVNDNLFLRQPEENTSTSQPDTEQKQSALYSAHQQINQLKSVLNDHQRMLYDRNWHIAYLQEECWRRDCWADHHWHAFLKLIEEHESLRRWGTRRFYRPTGQEYVRLHKILAAIEEEGESKAYIVEEHHNSGQLTGMQETVNRMGGTKQALNASEVISGHVPSKQFLVGDISLHDRPNTQQEYNPLTDKLSVSLNPPLKSRGKQANKQSDYKISLQSIPEGKQSLRLQLSEYSHQSKSSERDKSANKCPDHKNIELLASLQPTAASKTQDYSFSEKETVRIDTAQNFPPHNNVSECHTFQQRGFQNTLRNTCLNGHNPLTYGTQHTSVTSESKELQHNIPKNPVVQKTESYNKKFRKTVKRHEKMQRKMKLGRKLFNQIPLESLTEIADKLKNREQIRAFARKNRSIVDCTAAEHCYWLNYEISRTWQCHLLDSASGEADEDRHCREPKDFDEIQHNHEMRIRLRRLCRKLALERCKKVKDEGYSSTTAELSADEKQQHIRYPHKRNHSLTKSLLSSKVSGSSKFTNTSRSTYSNRSTNMTDIGEISGESADTSI